MKQTNTNISGLIIIEPLVFSDERGYFFESYHKQKLEAINNVEFVQDNESKSQQNVLRGLHFQKPPFAQGKLVRVIKGAVLDVALDIRKNSPTFGKHYSIRLDEQNKLLFYIPEGFAHGFLTLSNDTIFSYKCTNFYSKPHEECIQWNDDELEINWGISSPTLSEKDTQGISFKNLISPF
jgi:dTDP-4-dehydrorhamnose 3,5-epimerase